MRYVNCRRNQPCRIRYKELPKGQTCGDCEYFETCVSVLGSSIKRKEDTICNFDSIQMDDIIMPQKKETETPVQKKNKNICKECIHEEVCCIRKTFKLFCKKVVGCGYFVCKNQFPEFEVNEND